MKAPLALALILAAAGTGRAASIETLNVQVAPGHRQDARFINNQGDVIVSNDDGGFHLQYYLAHPPRRAATQLDLPGDPTGLNDSGQIIGSSFILHSPQFGFVYQNGQVRRLNAPGCSDTEPSAINNAGEIAIVCPGAQPDQATSFLLTNGIYTPIAVPGAIGTFAYALNQKGVVAGIATMPLSVTVAFTDDHGTITTYAGPPGENPDDVAINDAGVFVMETGHYVSLEYFYRSFLVQPDGSMTEIVDPDGAQVRASSINDAGQVTGALVAAGAYSPFYYHSGNIIHFPAIPPGYDGFGNGINEAGEIAAGLNTLRSEYKGAYVAQCTGDGC